MPNISPDTHGRWALLVGGSSGIGLAQARLLAARGFSIALVGRDASKLAASATALRGEFGVEVDTLTADLAHRASASRVTDWASRHDVGVYATTAGEGRPGAFVDGDLAAYLDCVEVKVVSTLTITHAVARQMRDAGRGAILLVSSTGGLQGVPGLANNAAAEAWVLTFAESLHHELEPAGVTVAAMLPSATATPGLHAMMPAGATLPRGVMTAEATAAEGLAALDGAERIRIAGRHNRAFMRWFPRSARSRLLGRLMGELTGTLPTPQHATT